MRTASSGQAVNWKTDWKRRVTENSEGAFEPHVSSLTSQTSSLKPTMTRRFTMPIVGLLFAASLLLGQQEQPPSRAAIIRMDGQIDPRLDAFVARSIEKAQRQNVQVVVFEIDSPGGYVISSFDLAERFQQLAWAKAVAYVPREALSGASIAALGCPDIYVAANARFGNAGPIFADQDGAFRHVPEKIRSDLALRMRQLADFHQRPATLAEAFVDSDLKVFEVRHRESGAISYLSQKEFEALPADEAAQYELGPQVVESGDGRFLEVLGKRAVQLNLATGIAENRQELLEKYQITEPPLVFEPGTVDHVIGWLNNPFVTGLLFLIGLVALYTELSAPGLGVGGGVAALCFSLFFWSRFLGGTAGWLEVILFLMGIMFLLLEFFVVPGFGIPGLAGITLVVVSLILASQDFVIPSTPRERQYLAVSVSVLAGSGFLFLGYAVLITKHFGRLPVLSRLVLPAPIDRSADGDASVVGVTDSILYPVNVGDIGVSESPLRPAGKAQFGDAYVDVVADGSFVESGRPVKVIRTGGNRIVVREIEEKQLTV